MEAWYCGVSLGMFTTSYIVQHLCLQLCVNNASFSLMAGVKVLGSHKYEQGGLINFYHYVHTKLFAPCLKFVVLKLAKTLVRMENSNNTAWHKVHSKY